MGTHQLTWFNQLPARAAREALLECCSAPGWAEQMAADRPYASAEEAIERSAAFVAALSAADLAAALAGHPRIGERPEPGTRQDGSSQDGSSKHRSSQDGSSKHGARAADWSRREQAGVDAGDTQMRQALSEANLEYEQRFGHIYLVCASGRTGSELLALLRGRLQNEPEDEWQVVRTELQKINELRLRQMLAGVE